MDEQTGRVTPAEARELREYEQHPDLSEDLKRDDLGRLKEVLQSAGHPGRAAALQCQDRKRAGVTRPGHITLARPSGAWRQTASAGSMPPEHT